MRAEIEAVLARRGEEEYAGEPVSQLQHALQCAALAEAEAADDTLVTAALLHDLGHLMEDDPDGEAARGSDACHENSGAWFLAQWFGPAVTEPIRMHVDAKRWLCLRRCGYAEGLSSASLRSLALQGGAFSDDEADAFLCQPHAAAAIRLRLWDDAAKDPAAVTPPLSHFLDIAERVMR